MGGLIMANKAIFAKPQLGLINRITGICATNQVLFNPLTMEMKISPIDFCSLSRRDSSWVKMVTGSEAECKSFIKKCRPWLGM